MTRCSACGSLRPRCRRRTSSPARGTTTSAAGRSRETAPASPSHNRACRSNSHFRTRFSIKWQYPQLCSSFAFEFVVGDLTLKSLISQKANDMHSQPWQYLIYRCYSDRNVIIFLLRVPFWTAAGTTTGRRCSWPRATSRSSAGTWRPTRRCKWPSTARRSSRCAGSRRQTTPHS